MRTFQVVFLILFIVFYFLITIGAIKGISKIIPNKWNLFIRYFAWAVSALLLLTFGYLYVINNPSSASTGFNLYYLFNALLFLDLFSKIPVALAWAMLKMLKVTNHILLYSSIIISISLGLVMLSGTGFGNKQLEIKRFEIETNDLPERFDGYEIVHISDLHLGSFMNNRTLIKKAADAINEISPDAVLFTGDLVNNFDYETEGWEPFLTKITRGRPCFSVLGNHDYGNYSEWENETEKQENFDNIIKSHERFGFKLLRNESTELVAGKDTIYLIGVENWGHPPFPQYADLDRAMSEVPDSGLKILMTHDPTHWESQVRGKKDIDLTLSGHSHGLQWAIRPAGIPFSLSYLVMKNWGGLYRSGDNYLYVNTGLGIVGIPWRIDIPAELTVITLKRSEIDRE